MEHKRLFYLCILTFCLSTSFAQQNNRPYEKEPEYEKEPDYVPYSEERYDNFDWNLAKELQGYSFENEIISPISVKMVLAMLYEASTMSTEVELLKVLNLPVSRHATRERFQQIISSLTTISADHTLKIASNIFLNQSLQPLPRYKDTLERYYNVEIKSVNFDKNADAAKDINAWASQATDGHVEELVTPDSLQDALVLLTNAIYYKGMWQKPFNKNFTKTGTFTTSQGRILSDVQYMIHFETYYYSDYKKLNSQVLRLPFKGGISMFIVLPNNPNGLRQLIKNITPKEMQDIRWSLNKHEIYVYLPRFAFKYNAQLKNVLETLGLRRIFQNIASLPGLSTGKDEVKNVVVKDVIQEAGIEINEEGGSVWAASALQLVNKFGTRDTIFNASHPFLFFIEDERSGNVLFVGKMEDPKSAEKMDLFEQILSGQKSIPFTKN